MDHFGIGAAMQGVASVYFRSARRTGRTTSLVESVKDGDRIVFADRKEADRVRRLCLERGVKVECLIIPPEEPHRLFERDKSKGRTLFGHTWVELFYLDALRRGSRFIDDLQREKSSKPFEDTESPWRNKVLHDWRI